MKEGLYFIFLVVSFALGWRLGWAEHPWAMWIGAPILSFVMGATIRMFWGHP